MRISVGLILALILFLAVTLRVWNLAGNPPGLTWDEAALGYNAYSILQTGRDEYGTLFPLNLKSFGDYKPALYAYLSVPFIAVFGLNELVVRLPSALFGVLAVLGIYLLVRELFKNRFLSLLSAFFLAISPWHIQFSRPAFEANFALSLTIFGVYFFIRGIKENRFLVLSSLLFGLSLFAYQGSRIFIPFLLLALYSSFRNGIKLDKKFKTFGAVLIFFFVFLFLTTVLTGQTQRLSALNFFSYTRSAEEISLIAKEDGLTAPIFTTLHGEWFSYVRGLAERYLVYFSPNVLFIDGDYSERQSVPDLGALYYFSILFIPLGLFKLIKDNNSQSRFILLWLLLAPIPAVLSRDLLTTLRAINMIIPWVIVDAIGLYFILNLVRKFNLRIFYVTAGVLGLLIFANLLIFLDRYFIHAPIEYSKFWLYGYKQTLSQIGDVSKYNKVVITDKFGQPYIYYLFYTKYPPQKLHQQIVLDQPTVDVGTVRKIDNIEFRSIYWPKDRGEKNSLFIGTNFELPDQDVIPFPEYSLNCDIHFLNGEQALRIVKTR